MTDRPPLPRDFWLLWGSSTISNLGDGIRLTALPLLVVTLTTDPLAVGAVTTASFLPWLAFALVGGAIADRHDRKKLILTAQILRAIVVAGFALLVLTGNLTLAAVYVVAVVIGAGEVVADSALQAAVPRLAGDDLDTANSRFASGQLVAQEIAGGPIGASLFVLSQTLPFVVDAATFGVGALLITMITKPLQETEPADRPKSSLFDDIGEGARFLWNQPVLRGLALAVSLSNLADSAARSLLVLLVVDILDGSEIVFGLLMTATALGGVAGSVAAPRVIAKLGRRAALIGAFALLAASTILIGLSPNVVVVGIASFGVLFAVVLFNVSGHSIRQRLTPDRLLGRVIATARLFGLGAIPIGSIGGGLLARQIGVRETMVVAGGVAVMATVAVIVATQGQDLEPAAPAV